MDWDADRWSGGAIALTALIPVIAALTGYGTNALALQMTFYPLRYHGLRCCGVRVLGWQGIIPSRAREMAEIAVDTISDNLLSVRDVFSRLDPVAFRERVSGHLEPVCERILEAVLSDVLSVEAFESLPSGVKREYVAALLRDAPLVVEAVIRDMGDAIDEVFDLKAVVVGVMTSDAQLVVDVFQTTGEKEFVFLRNSGLYFGFLFGVAQMALWLLVPAWWILPIAGFVVGTATNYLALYLIFNPIEPVRLCGAEARCCGKRLQGLFLQRQTQVAEVYARVVQTRILQAKNLIVGLHQGGGTGHLFRLIANRVREPVDRATQNLLGAIASGIVGAETLARARHIAAVVVMRALPEMMLAVDTFMEESLAVQEVLQQRLAALPPSKFERMLHPIFEKDELQLILVGGALGLIVGFIQVALNSLV